MVLGELKILVSEVPLYDQSGLILSTRFHRPAQVTLTPSTLWSECGTHKTVKARFWPWLSGKSPCFFKVVPSSLGSSWVTPRPHPGQLIFLP